MGSGSGWESPQVYYARRADPRKQLVRRQMTDTPRGREGCDAKVGMRQVRVGTGIEQHLQDLDATAPPDRPVEGAQGVEVRIFGEEPAQARRVFEVEFVGDHSLVSRSVEKLEKRRPATLAGMVKRVVVTR